MPRATKRRARPAAPVPPSRRAPSRARSGPVNRSAVALVSGQLPALPPANKRTTPSSARTIPGAGADTTTAIARHAPPILPAVAPQRSARQTSALRSKEPHLVEQRQLRPILGELGEAFPVLRVCREDPLAERVGGHADDVAAVALDEQKLVITRRPRQAPNLFDLARRQSEAHAKALHGFAPRLPNQFG